MTEPNEAAKEEAIKIPDVLPVLPLKDLVIFPFIIVPLSVSREKSINAVDQALAENRVIMLTPPDGRFRILVEGVARARIDYFTQTAPFFKAKTTRTEEPVPKERGLET